MTATATAAHPLELRDVRGNAKKFPQHIMAADGRVLCTLVEAYTLEDIQAAYDEAGDEPEVLYVTPEKNEHSVEGGPFRQGEQVFLKRDGAVVWWDCKSTSHAKRFDVDDGVVGPQRVAEEFTVTFLDDRDDLSLNLVPGTRNALTGEWTPSAPEYVYESHRFTVRDLDGKKVGSLGPGSSTPLFPARADATVVIDNRTCRSKNDTVKIGTVAPRVRTEPPSWLGEIVTQWDRFGRTVGKPQVLRL